MLHFRFEVSGRFLNNHEAVVLTKHYLRGSKMRLEHLRVENANMMSALDQVLQDENPLSVDMVTAVTFNLKRFPFHDQAYKIVKNVCYKS
jgi:hypothetical protein